MNFNSHRVYRQPLVLLLALVALMTSLLSSLAVPVEAASGDLDPTFGIAGKVTSSAFGSADSVRAIAIQRDGKIVVAGTGFRQPPPQTWSDVGLARFNLDGTPDQTFGAGGFVVMNFFDFDGAFAVGIQSDGRIVVGGYTSNGMGKPLSLLARFNPDGSLDSTFGNLGRIRGADFSHIYALVILPNDKIFAVGFVEFGSYLPRGYQLARLNADGTPDQTFNGSGYVLTPTSDGPAYAVAVQPDSKFIIGGGDPFKLVRYLADGSIDTSYGTNGVVTAAFTKPHSVITALALQSDGRIVAAGYVGDTATGPFDFALARFKSNGSPDKSFNGDGRVTTDFFGEDDAARALIIQPDGRLVAVGYASRAGNYDFALARYNGNGSLDSTFGSGGKATTDFNGGNDKAYAAALQSDGKLIAAGGTVGTIAQGALARYRGDGFDLILQDESNGNILQIDSATGQYLFKNCAGTVLGGTGSVTRRGATLSLQHNGSDRKVQATVDGNTHRANATIKILGGGPAYSILDRDVTNNTGTCP
jgi:uncharacterized delta-60 repeat protein